MSFKFLDHLNDKAPLRTEEEWFDTATPEQYFRKAFKLGKENNLFVQRMRRYFSETYSLVEAEFRKDLK